MARLDRFIFGYRDVSVGNEGAGTLANLFLKHHISSHISEGGSARISERDYKRLQPELDAQGAKVSGLCGLPSAVRRLRVNYLPAIAVAVAVLVNLLSSRVVFDIRVSGNDTVPDYLITEALDKAGLTVGSFWHSLDLNALEASVLLELPAISWINVNQRGSVAYVEVVERKNTPEEVPENSYVCNIVADTDCIIEEIIVERGVPLVKPGDVVKQGDILISGTVETEFGTEFVQASGSVKGQSTAKLTENVSREERVSLGRSYHLAEMRLNIFKLSINIFKNYRNSADECDIIVDNETLVVFSDKKLPFGLTRIYESTESFGLEEYTDSRLIEITHQRHREALFTYLSGAELVKIRTDGRFTSSGYSVTSDIVYSREVGKEKIIVVDSLGE